MGNRIPLLTICIPTYNRARSLDCGLFSICTQINWDNLPVEVVISDNASTDDTEAIGRKWHELFEFVTYHKNNENIGGINNFWKVTESVTTKYFWLMSDDFLIVPGAIKHVLDVLSNYPETSLILAAGTNNYYDQPDAIRKLILKQGNLVIAHDAMSKKELVCSFWLQTLGCISYLLFNTELWRKTSYNEHAQYFIYPQIRSVFEVASMDGTIIFSNYLCARGYHAHHDHNDWYLDKAPVSLCIEFPWLQSYAIELGFDTVSKGGVHHRFFMSRLKQWIRMLISHPNYSLLYKQAINIQKNIFQKVVFVIAMVFIVPLSVPIRLLLKHKGVNILDNDKINLDQSA